MAFHDFVHTPAHHPLYYKLIRSISTALLFGLFYFSRFENVSFIVVCHNALLFAVLILFTILSVKKS